MDQEESRRTRFTPVRHTGLSTSVPRHTNSPTGVGSSSTPFRTQGQGQVPLNTRGVEEVPLGRSHTVGGGIDWDGGPIQSRGVNTRTLSPGVGTGEKTPSREGRINVEDSKSGREV